MAAEMRIFLFFLQKSFIKYLVLKLSVPSQIISKFFIIELIFFFEIFILKVLILFFYKFF